MRIICDNCSRPISGAVKRLAGNFNLHPDCQAQLGKDTRRQSPAVLCWGQEPSIGALEEWKSTGCFARDGKEDIFSVL